MLINRIVKFFCKWRWRSRKECKTQLLAVGFPTNRSNQN